MVATASGGRAQGGRGPSRSSLRLWMLTGGNRVVQRRLRSRLCRIRCVIRNSQAERAVATTTGQASFNMTAATAAGRPEHLPEPASPAVARDLRLRQTTLPAPELARELSSQSN